MERKGEDTNLAEDAHPADEELPEPVPQQVAQFMTPTHNLGKPGRKLAWKDYFFSEKSNLVKSTMPSLMQPGRTAASVADIGSI